MQNKTDFLDLPRDQQKAIIESLIFASEDVINFKTLFKLLITNEPIFFADKESNDLTNKTGEITIDDEIAEKNNFTADALDGMIKEINQELINTGRPYQIVNFAGGYQFSTLPHYGYFVHNYIKSKTKRRLSQASMETLSIIAYKQPITKPEIEQIRGVNSNEIVNSLIEKNFVKIVGRKNVLGKPLLFATTQDFLKTFGLHSLDDLPKLREIEDIANSLSNESSNSNDDFTIVIKRDEE